MVRIQSFRPSIQTFIFASTKEFTNSPQKNATSEANTMRGVCPKTASYADWFSHREAGGSATMTKLMNEANASAAKPAQITFRARA